VIVERMTEADVSDVLAIETASFRESRPRLSERSVGTAISDPKKLSASRGGRLDASQIREELARPWARLWVARGGESEAKSLPTVAFLLAWHVADELHVLDVATHPELRRRGYGRALMQQSLAYAREHAIKHLLLEVRRSNSPAIRLYRDCGFFAMGLRKKYYPDDEDAVEMALVLDERGEVDHRPDEVSV
jgi:ribosomal-protein-alanine N-acetyltransferase